MMQCTDMESEEKLSDFSLGAAKLVFPVTANLDAPNLGAFPCSKIWTILPIKLIKLEGGRRLFLHWPFNQTYSVTGALSCSITWSIVKLAAFWRGG